MGWKDKEVFGQHTAVGLGSGKEMTGPYWGFSSLALGIYSLYPSRLPRHTVWFVGNYVCCLECEALRNWNAINFTDVKVRLSMTVMVSKYKLNIFLLVPNGGKKWTWIFDPLPMCREMMRSLVWVNRSSSRLLAWGSCLISILSGCGFEAAVTEGSQVLWKTAHQFRRKLIM